MLVIVSLFCVIKRAMVTLLTNRLSYARIQSMKNKFLAVILLLSVCLPFYLALKDIVVYDVHFTKILGAFGIYIVTPLAAIRLFFSRR